MGAASLGFEPCVAYGLSCGGYWSRVRALCGIRVVLLLRRCTKVDEGPVEHVLVRVSVRVNIRIRVRVRVRGRSSISCSK